MSSLVTQPAAAGSSLALARLLDDDDEPASPPPLRLQGGEGGAWARHHLTRDLLRSLAQDIQVCPRVWRPQGKSARLQVCQSLRAKVKKDQDLELLNWLNGRLLSSRSPLPPMPPMPGLPPHLTSTSILNRSLPPYIYWSLPLIHNLQYTFRQ